MGRHPLDDIRVAKPCPASWDAMSGDDRVRFCSECKLNVYNLSGMNRQAVTELFELTEGRLCVRFYRRKDGTILTQDCPISLRVTAPFAGITAFLFAISVPFWGTLLMVKWQDIQAAMMSWFTPARPTMGRPMQREPVPGMREVLGARVAPEPRREHNP